MLKKRLDQVHQNTQLTFGMTEKGAEQAGIKYFKLADTMKLVSERQKAMFASAKGAYQGSSVPGLTLSITDLKKEKENAKKNLGEFVDIHTGEVFKPTQYLRSMNFSLAQIKNCSNVVLTYLTQDLEDYRGHMTKTLYTYLTKLQEG